MGPNGALTHRFVPRFARGQSEGAPEHARHGVRAGRNSRGRPGRITRPSPPPVPAPPDYYATLGVAEDASAKEIKKAYRSLAQQYHPDRNAGDAAAEERFKEVQSAYDVVGDETKRKAYDRARRDPFGGQYEGTPFGNEPGGGGRFYRAPDGTYVRVDATGAGPGGNQDAFTFDGGGGLGDIFDQFFGGASGPAGGAREQPYRGGRDVDATVRLTFEEALAGGRAGAADVGRRGRPDHDPQGGPRRVQDQAGRPRRPGAGRAGRAGRPVHHVPRDARRPVRARRRRPGHDRDRLGRPGHAGHDARGADGDRQDGPPAGQAGTQPGTRLRVRGQGVETTSGTGDLYVVVEVAVPTLSEAAADSLRASGRRGRGDGLGPVQRSRAGVTGPRPAGPRWPARRPPGCRPAGPASRGSRRPRRRGTPRGRPPWRWPSAR